MVGIVAPVPVLLELVACALPQQGLLNAAGQIATDALGLFELGGMRGVVVVAWQQDEVIQLAIGVGERCDVDLALVEGWLFKCLHVLTFRGWLVGKGEPHAHERLLLTTAGGGPDCLLVSVHAVLLHALA